jgi:hypothetical protein
MPALMFEQRHSRNARVEHVGVNRGIQEAVAQCFPKPYPVDTVKVQGAAPKRHVRSVITARALGEKFQICHDLHD